MKINKKLTVCVVSGLLLFSCGCSAENMNINGDETLTKGTLIINSGKEKTYTNINASHLIKNHAQQRDYNHECAEVRAENIATSINEIDGIKKAAVVVTGSKAIIGLTLEHELNDNELIKLKYEVDATAKQTDLSIKRTAVSTAPDLFERALDLSNGDDEKEKECLKKYKDNEALFRLIPTI